LDDDERQAAQDRIIEQLGVMRMGTEPGAPPLPPREVSPLAVTAASRLPIEDEITTAQVYGYGEVWGRPGLDLRTRSFITLGLLQVLYESDQLHIHINNAVNAGITPEEIHETFLHAGVYGGLSGWHNATNVARFVFVQRGILDSGPTAQYPTTASSTATTRAHRQAARDRVMAALGVGRIGLEPDAPRLAPLPGGPAAVKSSTRLPIEDEMAAIQGEYGFGEVWGRPGLDLRTRSFITMGLLQVLHESDQLHTHVNSALNIGITPEEIHETFLHSGVYGGLSGWHNATNVARDVFVQRGILEP
jgi:4-carboxymuconolactone decarboxylase